MHSQRAIPHSRAHLRLPGLLLVLGAACMLSASCAKTGDPQPPLLRVHKPASDLAAIQVSDRITLTVSLPAENTTGTAAVPPGVIEVLRVTDSDRTNSSPLPEDEFLRRAEPILSIPKEGIGQYETDGRLTIHDSQPAASSRDLFTKAFRYAVRFINRDNQTAGLSNQVFLAPVAIPAPPSAVSADISQDRILLTWEAPAGNADGSRPPRVAGYQVYRSESPDKFTGASLNNSLLQTPKFEDRQFEFGKTYYYAVSIVGSRENPYAESHASRPLMVEARDTFPPENPQNLTSVTEGDVVILLWSASPQGDVAGYRVYRRVDGSPERQLLSTELVRELSYRDQTAQPGTKYVYTVAAVDRSGNEGPGAETPVER